MEIYGAESHVQKVNEFLEELLDKNPKMYSKTKQRLHRIGLEFSKGLNLISRLLEEEALEVDGEFDTDRSELSEVVSDLYQNSKATSRRMKSLQQFVNNSSDEIDKSDKLSNLSLTTSKRKFIISKYGSVLQQLAESKIEYPKVAACARLMWRWFEHRFFISVKYCPDFRYNIRMIPEWIRDIVVAYGYSVACGLDSQFISNFNQWCDSLLYSDTGNTYAIPKEIHECNKNMSANYVTYSALGIWDILFDAGLDKLQDDGLGEFQLSSFMVSDLFNQYDSQTADQYTYCNHNNDLLKEYHLLEEVTANE